MAIKDHIRASGLKQMDIARRLGVSEPTVSQWVNRQRDIPSRYIGPLAEMLSVPAETLLPMPERPAA